MKKCPWIALSALLWTTGLQAQATPTAPAAKPAATTPTASPTAAPSATPPSTKPSPAPTSAPAAKPATPATPAGNPGGGPATSTAKPAPVGAAAAANPNDKSVEWTLDTSHSHINFVARHLGFSKATGQFKKFAATIKADPKTAKISTLEATAETASIDTGIEKRDAHLRSDDFFNAEKFPQLKLVAKSIKWSGNKFTAQVDLTIRDITKTVPFKGELLGVHQVNFGQGPQLRAGYEATATINRKDFGLKWNMVTEGLSVVADPIQLELATEISYTPPAATTAAGTPAPNQAAATAQAAKVETKTTAAQAAATATTPAAPSGTAKAPTPPANAKPPAAPAAPTVKAPSTPTPPAAPTTTK